MSFNYIQLYHEIKNQSSNLVPSPSNLVKKAILCKICRKVVFQVWHGGDNYYEKAQNGIIFYIQNRYYPVCGKCCGNCIIACQYCGKIIRKNEKNVYFDEHVKCMCKSSTSFCLMKNGKIKFTSSQIMFS